ncbi:MAG: VWA domain-containing protein [Candidatus Marinimicrobia bacterium]|nr:VWA domain-containing protein [Candidatus Neomarinimicrobiota bacterium]
MKLFKVLIFAIVLIVIYSCVSSEKSMLMDDVRKKTSASDKIKKAKSEKEKKAKEEEKRKRTATSDPHYYSSSEKSEEEFVSKPAESDGRIIKDKHDFIKDPAPNPMEEMSSIIGKKSGSHKQISGLKAGYSDDNKQYNYFLKFLNKYKNQVGHYDFDISERFIIKVVDRNDKPIPNADVYIESDGKILTRGKTNPDGSYLFFSSKEKSSYGKYTAYIKYSQRNQVVNFYRNSKRNIEVRFDAKRVISQKVPVDILFILDVTGSMGEEIERLKQTIELINLNLNSVSDDLVVRFGMVLYRDTNDDFITKVIPLTSNLTNFQKQLKKIRADGGGDTPEDLQSALSDAINKIEWNKNGIRLGYIITDAPPQLYENQKDYNYIDIAIEAKEKAIKLFSVGTGGLPISGEYILRQISQITSAKYIFLTYGEKGESDGGEIGSVSHHTGENFQTDKLETIIIRFAKEEISHFLEFDIADDDEFFEANKIDDEESNETLSKLFEKAISQLWDYSTINISGKVATAVIPIAGVEEDPKQAEYFTEQLTFSLKQQKSFVLVRKDDLQNILDEVAIQLSGMVDEKAITKAGKLLGAKLLITGKLYKKSSGKYELFLKLLRVETGEILSVTKLVIDNELGL